MPLNINGTTGISGVDGSASAPALQGTDSNTGINFGSDTVNINTGGTTRATVDSAGDLGLGVSPTNFGTYTTLHLKGPSGQGAAIRLQDNSDTPNTDDFVIYKNSANAYLRVNGSDPLIAYLNGDERLKISSDGTFDVKNSTYAYFQSNSTSTASMTLKKSASGANGIDYFQCRDSSNTLELAIAGTGGVYNIGSTYGALSDNKLKENIVDAKSQWDDIKNVKVRNFNFKSSTGHPTDKYIGVVAQELETVSPSLVSEVIDRDPDTSEDLGTKTKTVKYSILYMKAIKCLQEAQARIETLETEKTKLQTDLTALTARVTALEAG